MSHDHASSSILDIILKCDRIVDKTKHCIQADVGSSPELFAILVEISSLKSTLESLRFLQDFKNFISSGLLFSVIGLKDGGFQDCGQLCAHLLQYLGRIDGGVCIKRQKTNESLDVKSQSTSHGVRDCLDKAARFQVAIHTALRVEACRAAPRNGLSEGQALQKNARCTQYSVQRMYGSAINKVGLSANHHILPSL